MKAATARLHDIAETTGTVKDIINGTVSQDAYCLYLRNLLPIYEALEDEDIRSGSPFAQEFVTPNLRRALPIRADLDILMPEKDWAALPVLSAAVDYIDDILKTKEDGGSCILGHIYVRYLGDLHGGQILKNILRQRSNFPVAALSFYDFPKIADVKTFRTHYRTRMNTVSVTSEQETSIISAALSGFQHNVELSKAISRQSV